MDKTPLDTTPLDGLSTTELVRMAEARGIFIPLGLERVFIIEALREAAAETPPEDGLIPEPPYQETPRWEAASWEAASWEAGGGLRETPQGEGSFREGSFREGSFREGSFREGSFREGSFREGSFREGSFLEGAFREAASWGAGGPAAGGPQETPQSEAASWEAGGPAALGSAALGPAALGPAPAPAPWTARDPQASAPAAPHTAHLTVRSKKFEPAPLPDHYHITFVDVLVRDPMWAFVFWEVRGPDKDQYENAADFAGYYLRLAPADKNDKRPAAPASAAPAAASSAPAPAPQVKKGEKAKEEKEKDDDDVFTVAVGPADSAWYLGFPPSWTEGAAAGAGAKRWYTVELGVATRGGHVPLAVSRRFRVPDLLRDPARPAPAPEPGGKPQALPPVYRNPLAAISGRDDFSLLYQEDQTPRRRCSPGTQPAEAGRAEAEGGAQ